MGSSKERGCLIIFPINCCSDDASTGTWCCDEAPVHFFHIQSRDSIGSGAVKGRLFFWYCAKRKHIRRSPNRPCRSMSIGYRMLSFHISSPIAQSPSIIDPVTVFFLHFHIIFNLSLSCICASEAAVTFPLKYTDTTIIGD